MTLFDTGVRPKIDEYIDSRSKERRDYGDYWSASSAGYCMRKNIFERLKVPYVGRDARTQRVFEAGHIFHEFIQRITKDAGVSIAQELELQDEELMVRGHIDDLILVEGSLILYDYKTQNSRAFSWQKDKPISHYHRMQLSTYMYMLRGLQGQFDDKPDFDFELLHQLGEGRILKISKDDLRMSEQQLMWSPDVESRVKTYWGEQNQSWERYKQSDSLPPCTCADYENGFMASDKYNPFFYQGEPCSVKWYEKHKGSIVKV